ncbi:MAG: hypothetical protein E5V64_06700 [Mesorhizobium sp.]|uniref:hypothetical protein n=1 Tax=Mesorhizobium sp. TaxID=1871066 RepID=UPI0011FC9D78|nr:hypothetical protein [Mesorhizobium sp.]TIV83849.1 MAG: hypothetical protein E5V64_06700 [Mesorhizobium sp.]
MPSNPNQEREIPDVELIAAELRAGLEGVTPGPWKHVCPDRGYCADYIVTENFDAKDGQRHSDYVAETGNVVGPRGNKFFEKDAAHIARCSPENIRALLDELARQGEALKLAREALDAMVHAVCGESGFANAVRVNSGFAYPWPALDEAEALAIEVIMERTDEKYR